MFVQKNQHRPYDFWISLVIFLIGWGLGLLAARAITPHISPEAYQVYIDGISECNYISMWDNCAFEFGIIPVLIYLGFAGKEWKSLLELNQ